MALQSCHAIRQNVHMQYGSAEDDDTTTAAGAERSFAAAERQALSLPGAVAVGNPEVVEGAGV